ncbi:MAG: ATP-dependent Clp protease ATP-binding subunit, partial [Planctomycetes bacterium]|nr:ATP-dependent Clp protease ATP-binding subunit [Planctomycetota bacterium]
VVLFDEIEKAHLDVFNMLLQIMEEGTLTDSFGRHIDFRNTVLIMTSNIGANIIKNQSSLGFKRTSVDRSYEEMKRELLDEVEKHFRPEFLNRLDEVIVFQSLSREDLRQIIDIEMQHVADRLEGMGLIVSLTDEARDFLIEKGYNPEFGARPLRRAIEQHIEDPLAEELLRGAYEGKNRLSITVRDGHLYFEGVEGPEGTEEPAEAVGASLSPGAEDPKKKAK